MSKFDAKSTTKVSFRRFSLFLLWAKHNPFDVAAIAIVVVVVVVVVFVLLGKFC
jgi:hypothetical protein